MYATWDFLKRHKRKIVAGTAVAATFYGAKFLLESPRMNQLVQQCLHGMSGETSGSSTVLDEDCLNEVCGIYFNLKNEKKIFKKLKKKKNYF